MWKRFAISIVPFVISFVEGIPSAALAETSPYVVDGQALGTPFQPDNPAYRRYQCGPSGKFPGFTWCHEEHSTKRNGDEVTRSHSILDDQNGTAWYFNSYIEPAVFGANDIQDEIDRISRKFGQPARIVQMPPRSDLPNAIMAVWGGIKLDKLSVDEVSVVASGGTHAGLLVSFLGDLERSAKAGVPVYRLAGSAGFLWVATVNQNGKGVLRYLTIDDSKIAASKNNAPQVLNNDSSPETNSSPSPAPQTNSVPTSPPTQTKTDDSELKQSKQSTEQSNLPGCGDSTIVPLAEKLFVQTLLGHIDYGLLDLLTITRTRALGINNLDESKTCKVTYRCDIDGAREMEKGLEGPHPMTQFCYGVNQAYESGNTRSFVFKVKPNGEGGFLVQVLRR
jgi:hypothetical protein